jgi:N-acetylmuramoyl-L-alanine amidase
MKKILSMALITFFIFTVKTNAAAPIKILLLPGHDNTNFGAEYGTRKEADMNLTVATKIYNILKQDPRFEVHITRDSGGYTKEFADYLSSQKSSVIAFEQNAKKVLQSEIANGSFVKKTNAPHHSVSQDIALRLYAYNKWAEENNVNAMVHIHFNDYPRANKWVIGKYKGFAIYVPDSQFPNAKESTNLAKSIFSELHKKYATSTFPPEKGGLISDQKLIAIGANGTLNASVRSVLIEYGYIYEKKFRVKSTRDQAYADMANLTATGIENYFFR